MHIKETGAIAWMARNPVAANLLLIIVIAAGLSSLSVIKKEVFPTFPADSLTVTVPYPGSSPEEVEEGIILKIEEEIQDIEGIKEIVSVASEGSGRVTVRMLADADFVDMFNKVKVRVDSITSFPGEAEEPVIKENLPRTRVINLSVYGPLHEKGLKELAEEVRDDLLSKEGITQVEIQGSRDYEITIEISDQALREYGLRFDDVVSVVRRQSLDLPGGTLRTTSGAITLRSEGQARTQDEFKNLVLLSRADGTRLKLGDVATVRDGFEDQPILSLLNGYPSVTLAVSRVGQQSPVEISQIVRDYLDEKVTQLPAGVEMSTWGDRSAILKGRMDLLLKNAAQGAVLVLLTLALFLQVRLALWVVVGVPFCFMGALYCMTYFGYSINVISLFAFILVLGIIVDDAIVTAESAYSTLEKENDGIDSIIRGVKKVSVATIFGVLTTIIAFYPMLFLTEGISRFFGVISSVVIFSLMFSIIESKLILPTHLRHIKVHDEGDGGNFFVRLQKRFSKKLVDFSKNVYGPFLQKALRQRYITLACFILFFMLANQLIPSGLVRFIFFPNVPSDNIEVDLEMPPNTPYKLTHDYAMRLQDAALYLNERYREESGEDVEVIENLQVRSDTDTSVNVRVSLIPSTERQITSVEMAKWWREKLGELPGVKSLSFDANAGHPSIPIDIELQAKDLNTLRNAALETKELLRNFSGVYDIRDSFDSGGLEVDVQITPQGEALGLGQAELARQVRQAFFGAEIQRIQRGRHEVRVYARFPESERDSLQTLQDMWIGLPDGSQVPFSVVGKIVEQQGINKITRVDRQRIVNVQANVDKGKVEPDKVLSLLQEKGLPELLAKYPGLAYKLSGESEDQQASNDVLYSKGLLMLMMIFAALAIPLKSYFQPVIIMSVIPFGLMGAIVGHFIVGKEVSILSIVGMVALSGIVVNDSLVLVDYINQRVREGTPFREAVANSGVERFRAVILTSVTTFVGLLPLQLETSIQAQFLKPMAISVSFGVLFATMVTLLLVPTLCYISDDMKQPVAQIRAIACAFLIAGIFGLYVSVTNFSLLMLLAMGLSVVLISVGAGLLFGKELARKTALGIIGLLLMSVVVMFLYKLGCCQMGFIKMLMSYGLASVVLALVFYGLYRDDAKEIFSGNLAI